MSKFKVVVASSFFSVDASLLKAPWLIFTSAGILFLLSKIFILFLAEDNPYSELKTSTDRSSDKNLG